MMNNPALIAMVCLALLYIADINFPLHRFNLWRRFLRKTHIAPPVFSKRTLPMVKAKASVKCKPPLKSHKGPKYTPDLSIGKIAVVSDSITRINNFITKHLSGNPNSLKYVKVYTNRDVAKLKATGLKQVHMIYGYDNLTGIEQLLPELMTAGTCNFYGDQLFMDI